ncbi:GNAT family N-acetyltransferase [Chitinophaga sp. Cy-1792]|uniref:GNAT family N-acetyltransferase n=1 Tax=Chitinophaga sp. Cy-1792 TaxID=2608339 RepID=UPI0014246B97|nr:GNAT family N-acetyltransferase [Chitinophaga sp. Cy-1792]NIG53663.1 GNAT family N-acetyltransferase [Chitinophaga sp. Cy-1792]
MLQTRKGTTADSKIIRALAEKIWPPTYGAILAPEQLVFMLDMMYSPASLEQQMNERHHEFIILEDEGTAIGYAAYSTTDLPAVFKLHKIYLDPDCQGKGAGKFLLNTVAAAVKEKGATILELDVNRYNKAKQFYEKQGFAVISEKNTEIGNGYLMEDYVMQKPL